MVKVWVVCWSLGGAATNIHYQPSYLYRAQVRVGVDLGRIRVPNLCVRAHCSWLIVVLTNEKPRNMSGWPINGLLEFIVVVPPECRYHMCHPEILGTITATGTTTTTYTAISGCSHL